MEEVRVVATKQISSADAAGLLKKYLRSRPEAKDPTALFALADDSEAGGATALEADVFVQLSFVQSHIEEMVEESGEEEEVVIRRPSM